MRRTAVLVAVCLLIGVVLNYAVAWVYLLLIVRTESFYSGSIEYEITAEDGWITDVPDHWPLDSWTGIESLLSHSVFRFKEISQFDCDPLGIPSDERRSYRVHRLVVGWPANGIQSTRVLSHTTKYGPGFGFETWKNVEAPPVIGIGAGIRFQPDKLNHRQYGASKHWPFLPLAPIWPGFAVNTLLYAIVPALIYMPFGPLKRWKRRRRGACLKCGYSLAGITSGTCPECGATRVPTRAPSSA